MAKTIPADEKVFMVSNSTNTTYSGSAALKAMSEWYTMEDVSNTVKPYKVFTALLTQGGGSSDEEVDGDGGSIVKGVTYYVNANPDNFDLTIYGAPNNDEGTYFIANQDATLPYTYTLQLYYNTGAPVANVLENTIGNLWFTYDSIGNYTIKIPTLGLEKQVVFSGSYAIDNSIPLDPEQIPFTAYVRITNSPIDGEVYIGCTNDGHYSNNVLYNFSIEIRVYN